MARAFINERNSKIRERFKSYDLKQYKLDFVLQELSKEFYLKPDTIYTILKGQGSYKGK